MTKQEIIMRSNMKIAEANVYLASTNEEVEFYKAFSIFNQHSDFITLAKMCEVDLFLAYINAKITDKEYEEIIEDTVYIYEDLLSLSKIDYWYMQEIIEIIMQHKDKDKIMKALKDSNKKRSKRYLTNIISSDYSVIVPEVVSSLLIKPNSNNNGIIKTLEYYDKYPEIMSEALDLVSTFKEFETEMQNADSTIDEIIEKYKVKKKDLPRILGKVKRVNKDNPLISKIFEALTLINKYYVKINDEEKRIKKLNKKQIEVYSNFINELKTIFNQDEIVDYEKIIKKIPDPEIRKSFLTLVYEHNIVGCQEIDGQYKELMNNSTIHYLALLKENNISKDEINLNKIMHNKYDDVVILLYELKKITNDKEVLIYGLENSDLETVKYLEEAVEANVITTKTINEYKTILISTSHEFICLQNNILVIKKYGFNPSIFSNNPNVILMNENLDKQFKILQKYGLLKLIKANNDYSFLNKNLEELLDKIIELGYIDYIIEDINILNEDNFNRLYLLKSIDEKISSKEELLEVLRTNSFIVPDSKLEYYIPSVASYYEEEITPTHETSKIEELDSYLVNDLYYNINGVIISKNRVLRYLDNNNQDRNNAIFQAIIKDSILSEEEIETIKEVLSTKIYKK